MSNDLKDLIGKSLLQKDTQRRQRGNPRRGNTRPRNSDRSQPQNRRRSHSEPFDRNYQFRNPYNFVQFIEAERPQDDPLGDFAPVVHDRFVGLTGRIQCTLSVKTPLFVSNSENVDAINPQHRAYEFYKDSNGDPAIPASSLRGMFRSIHQIITNSCSPMTTDQRLTRKLEAHDATWLVPAVVEGKEKNWKLRLLPGSINLQVKTGGGFRRGRQYAAWMHQYWPVRPSKTLRDPQQGNAKRFAKTREESKQVDVQGLKHGDKCYALIEDRVHAHPAIKYWDVLAISKERSKLRKPNGNKQRIVEGWLMLTNQNVESKHSERFFFSTNNSDDVIVLEDSMVKAYETLIADYQKRHQDGVAKRKKKKGSPNLPDGKDAGYSRFIYEKDARKVKEGTLVYTLLTGSSRKPIVKLIAPVAIPRTVYDRSVGEFLPKHKCACRSYNSLCPTCRTFGWVSSDVKDKSTSPSYAGRIRFSKGTKGKVEFTDEITLAILSSPKPTKTQFYLLDSQGKPSHTVDYNIKRAKLRGHKLYYHHGSEPSSYQKNAKKYFEYERVTDSKHDGKDDQNRTIKGAARAGSTFTFSLDFNNLTRLELGGLIWALKLKQGWFHRLGYAKPLGFGSVTVAVDKLEVLDTESRWKDIEQDGWQDHTSKVQQLQQDFESQMVDYYGIEFVRILDEMEKLLTEPDKLLPTHYPRPTKYPSVEGKNFEWFMRNKEQTLPLATSDDGLRLR